MTYSIFSQTPNNALTEPMFFGNPVNVARYDQQKHPIFEQLIEKQLSFFGVQKKSMYHVIVWIMAICPHTNSISLSVT